MILRSRKKFKLNQSNDNILLFKDSKQKSSIPFKDFNEKINLINKIPNLIGKIPNQIIIHNCMSMLSLNVHCLLSCLNKQWYYEINNNKFLLNEIDGINDNIIRKISM